MYAYMYTCSIPPDDFKSTEVNTIKNVIFITQSTETEYSLFLIYANKFILGKELMNERVRVEDGALRKQLSPPNYRWACRIQVAPNPESNGVIKIKLRPQTSSW